MLPSILCAGNLWAVYGRWQSAGSGPKLVKSMSHMPVNMYVWSVSNCIIIAETNPSLLLRQVTAGTKMHGIFGIYSQTLI